MDLECNEHEISRTKVPQSIQECCRNCVRILGFKQIYKYNIRNYGLDKNNLTLYNEMIKSERNCKLCGKSLPYTRKRVDSLILCSDCYIISSELIESTLVKKQISILYLPWWHDNTHCNACYSKLTFTSKCQKYCAYCYIFYVGCRYCLTTNIIFGPIVQSQCKKCKKISVIINSSSATINKYFIPRNILGNIFRENCGKIKWIPYSQFTDFKEIAKGGYGIIYKATWLSNNETIVLKRFNNSKDIGKDFLNELKSLQHCMKNNLYLIKTYGFTKDPKLEDYILVMKYASGGQKLHLGLSQAINSKSSNNEIYGVIPYIAPEVFKGFKFTQKADIYSLGMILWEFTTGCKPFDNIKHDYNLIYKILDGERPNITEDTPECYTNLMKSCWDPDPEKRLFISDICSTLRDWACGGKITKAEFNQADEKRMELIKSKKIGPEFAERRHSEAIYTSRPLSALISKYSSTYSSSAIFVCSGAVQYFSTSLKKRKHEVLTNFETHDNDGKRIKTSSSYP
ncbi:kinase-like domain-containing protein [Rhizophagus diaphanus]|nr:kinase-like domain-containing protein [Rhizophagus diaphanus] [Rhizophagus sp. MUCL 43196]